MIRSSQTTQPLYQHLPAPRRVERAQPMRDERVRHHVRGQRYHDIRCQEAEEEIREAFGRFSAR